MPEDLDTDTKLRGFLCSPEQESKVTDILKCFVNVRLQSISVFVTYTRTHR